MDLRGRLGGLPVPVLVVAGADDPVDPVVARRGARPGAAPGRMVVIPGVRHPPMSDAPERSPLLAAYLARLELTADDA